MTTESKPKARKGVRSWWVTANDANPRHGWHWSRYFRNPKDPAERANWGGPNWIKSALAFENIHHMRKGDAVVAYQAGQGFVGLARLFSDGYVTPESGEYDTFDLHWAHTVWLENPVPFQVVHQLPSAEQEIQALKAVHFGTVLSITPKGFGQMCNLMRAFNPARERQIDRFLSSGG